MTKGTTLQREIKQWNRKQNRATDEGDEEEGQVHCFLPSPLIFFLLSSLFIYLCFVKTRLGPSDRSDSSSFWEKELFSIGQRNGFPTWDSTSFHIKLSKLEMKLFSYSHFPFIHKLYCCHAPKFSPRSLIFKWPSFKERKSMELNSTLRFIQEFALGPLSMLQSPMREIMTPSPSTMEPFIDSSSWRSTMESTVLPSWQHLPRDQLYKLDYRGSTKVHLTKLARLFQSPAWIGSWYSTERRRTRTFSKFPNTTDYWIQ